MNHSTKIKEFILSLFFPNRCRLCDTVCDIRSELCESCEETLPIIEEEICYFCGSEKAKCTCKEKAMFYLSICAPFYYEGGPKKATVLLKYQANEQTLGFLSREMAKCVNKRYGGIDFDCITFVPAFKADEIRRGYNQAELLAKGIGKALNIPVYPLLNKVYETAPQHTLSEAERSGNLLGAFEINHKANFSIENTRILLCDDIKTTGSTLDECAKTLLINGSAEVRCITACVKCSNK